VVAVRYEIARAIIDERGVLAVHLNSIKHHQTLNAHTRGINPLSMLGIRRVQDHALLPARYYLYEQMPYTTAAGARDWQWVRYQDYTDPVKLPPWLADPAAGSVMPLSVSADEYDYIAADGHKHIGAWIDRAAQTCRAVTCCADFFDYRGLAARLKLEARP
jgi:hypothetical protein